MFERIRQEGLRGTLDRLIHGETSREDHPHGDDDARYENRYDRRGFEMELSGRREIRWPKGYQRSDQRIYEDVCETMTEDAELDASNLEVKVEDGIVTLTGTVESRAQKRLAEDLAVNQRGVKDVFNQVRIEAPLMQ